MGTFICGASARSSLQERPVQHRPKACFVFHLIGKVEIRLPRPGAFFVTLRMDPIVEPVVGGTECLVAPVMDGNGCRPSRELGRLYRVLTVPEIREIGRDDADGDSNLDIGLGWAELVVPAIRWAGVGGNGMETGEMGGE
jgi:hypothetical protein